MVVLFTPRLIIIGYINNWVYPTPKFPVPYAIDRDVLPGDTRQHPTRGAHTCRPHAQAATREPRGVDRSLHATQALEGMILLQARSKEIRESHSKSRLVRVSNCVRCACTVQVYSPHASPHEPRTPPPRPTRGPVTCLVRRTMHRHLRSTVTPLPYWSRHLGSRKPSSNRRSAKPERTLGGHG